MEDKTSPQLTSEAPHGPVVPAEAGKNLPHNFTVAQQADSVKNSAMPDITPKLVDEHGLTAEERAGYLDALAQDENAPDTQKENRPTRAKKDLRQDIMNLFSVPAGKRADMGRTVDAAAEELLRSGKLTEETRTALYEAADKVANYRNGKKVRARETPKGCPV